MKQKLLDNMAECLDIENDEINIETNFKELDEWDSLALLSFMAMLEDEFDIQMSRQQLDQINTMTQLLDFIEK